MSDLDPENNTQNRMLLMEARHNENLASFREVRQELRGINIRLEDIEKGREIVREDVAKIKAGMVEVLDMLRSAKMLRNGLTWCVTVGTALVIAYAAWVHK
jgi:hypothetical protein